MINLLPPEHANTIRYGRQNTVLRKWLIGSLVAIVGLILILLSGWIYIDQQSNNLQRSIAATNEQLKNQDLSKVQADAKEITGDIKVINQVLGSEVKFSDLIKAIGKDMPPGTILGSLSLSKVSGSIDLSASAKNYTAAAQIAANLSDPNNGLFTKVDVISVGCNAGVTQTYQCSTTLKALFSPAAKTQFLNVPKESHS